MYIKAFVLKSKILILIVVTNFGSFRSMLISKFMVAHWDWHHAVYMEELLIILKRRN